MKSKPSIGLKVRGSTVGSSNQEAYPTKLDCTLWKIHVVLIH